MLQGRRRLRANAVRLPDLAFFLSHFRPLGLFSCARQRADVHSFFLAGGVQSHWTTGCAMREWKNYDSTLYQGEQRDVGAVCVYEPSHPFPRRNAMYAGRCGPWHQAEIASVTCGLAKG